MTEIVMDGLAEMHREHQENRNKKFMFVTTTMFGGGAERVISLLSSAVAEQGNEVCILKYYQVNDEYLTSNKIKVINMSNGYLTDYRKISYLEKVKRIRRIIREEKPDVVIPFLSQVAICTEIAAVGLSANTVQSIRIDPASGPTNKLQRFLRDLLVYRSKCTFVQNQAQKAYFPKKYHHKIHVLFNPISENLLSATWNPPKNQFVVCGIGRLEQQKNFKLLMDAFKLAFSNTPEAVLRIYGEGAQREELYNYAQKCGIDDRIQMMGRCNDIQSVYENSSLFVLSSNFEGMPNTLLEAMAVGVPCISTDCPTGPRDLIDHGENGLLVPVADVDALAEAMRGIYEQNYDLYHMSRKAKEKIRQCCAADQIAAQMITICENI